MAVQFQPINPAPASAAIDTAWRELAEVEAVVAGAEGRERRQAESQATEDDALRRKYGMR